MNTAADPLRNRPDDWDVVVIGAGVAGGLSALLNARAGLRTLLIEAKAFPRSKVCGGCLNATAWSILERHGVAEALLKTGAVRLDMIQLSHGGKALCQPLQGMYSISRGVLDRTLLEFAVSAGAHFISGTRAKVGPAHKTARIVELVKESNATQTINAKVVVCADGLGHPSLVSETEFAATASPSSRFGLGATFASGDQDDGSRILEMIVGAKGYVGITRVEDGQLNIAAAVERSLMAQKKQPSEAIRSILNEAGRTIPAGFDDAEWLGTPALTRTSVRQAGERLFLIGDAAGYVEPFTGEGMAWGLLGAELNAEFVRAGVRCWGRRLSLNWEQTWKRYVRSRQWTCRALSMILKSPRLTRWGLGVSRVFPMIPAAVIRGICTARR